MTTGIHLGRAGSPLPAGRPHAGCGAHGVARPTQLSLPRAVTASKRLAQEWNTMAAMVRCYCHGCHDAAAELCPECRGLLDYATLRLDRCRYGAEKPTCANCPVHCYQRDRREQMRAVMRYAGPRMLWRHPVLSFRHWLDGFRKAPAVGRPVVPAGIL